MENLSFNFNNPPLPQLLFLPIPPSVKIYVKQHNCKSFSVHRSDDNLYEIVLYRNTTGPTFFSLLSFRVRFVAPNSNRRQITNSTTSPSSKRDKSGAALRVGRSGVSLVPAGPDRSTGRTKVRRVVAPAGRQGISPRYSAAACIALPLSCLVLPFASLPASQQPSAICCLLATMDNGDNASSERRSWREKERN